MIKQVSNGMIQETTEIGRYYIKDNVKYPSVTWIVNYYPKNEGFLKFIGDVGYEESIKIRDRAGLKGSRIHERIDEYYKTEELNTKDLTRDEAILLLSFAEWWDNLLKNNEVEVITNEISVVNEKEGYAGTVDLIVKINNVLWILDFKTSKMIQKEHTLQLSAYKHCGYEDARLGIVHLGEKYEFKEVEDKFDVFLACKSIWNEENK